MKGNRKRILHVVWSFNNGGIETMLVNISNHQCKNYDIGVMIVNSSYDENLLSSLSKEIQIFCIDRPIASKNPYYYAKINFLYRKFAPDIVHFHQLSLTKLFIKRKCDKWFYTQHCIPNSFSPNKHITKYIAISECVKKAITSLSPVNNCIVCYNGIDFGRIAEKEKLDKGLQPTKIVSAARLDTSIKGQDIIIEAIHLLPNEIKEGLTIDIYGDGPDKSFLAEMIKHYKLEDIVHLRGNISNTQLLLTLKEYDLSIHTSRIEGFGLSVVESIGCGIPVILSDIPGHNEICKECVYFTPNNAIDLSQKIAYCITNYDKIIEDAYKNKELTRNNFSIERMIINLDEIYNK